MRVRISYCRRLLDTNRGSLPWAVSSTTNNQPGYATIYNAPEDATKMFQLLK